MTDLSESLCWAVLAPLSAVELQRMIAGEWRRRFPDIRVDPPPWHVLHGTGKYNAIVCTSPGSEGTDRPFAEALSRRAAGRLVYSLWFDLDRQAIFEWRDGEEVGFEQRSPFEFAEPLGFDVQKPVGPQAPYTLAVVENATVQQVRRALGAMADEPWLQLAPVPIGVLVTAIDGRIGTQAEDIAAALPSVTIYYVQRAADGEDFTVLVLGGSEQTGRLRVPPLDDPVGLPDIKGARTPEAICEVLGLAPGALGGG